MKNEKRKRSIIIIIVIIAVIVVIVAIAVFAVVKFSSTRKQVSNQTSQSCPQYQSTPADSFDGKVYTNIRYGFSIDWTPNKDLYLSYTEPGKDCIEAMTSGTLAANGGLAFASASSKANPLTYMSIGLAKFDSLEKDQATACKKQAALNPGTSPTECDAGLTQDFLLTIKQGLSEKKLNDYINYVIGNNFAHKSPEQDARVEFINIQGGVGLLSASWVFNGNSWMINFIMLNNKNDLIKMSSYSPNGPVWNSAEEVLSSSQYAAFKKVVSSIKFIK